MEQIFEFVKRKTKDLNIREIVNGKARLKSIAAVIREIFEVASKERKRIKRIVIEENSGEQLMKL